MAMVSMVSEERPRGGAVAEPFEFGILHCQDRGAIAKLNAAVRMFSMQITRTLINAFSIASFSKQYFKLFQLNHLLILLILCWHHFWLQTMKLWIRTLNILVGHTVPVT